MTRMLHRASLWGVIGVTLWTCELLAGCAARPSTESQVINFRLPPGSLGRSLAWQQRLQVTMSGQSQPPLDALLETTPQALQLALIGAGKTLARLRWDGRSLQAEQGMGWPRAIPPERVLSDLQLALWPLVPLQAALPPNATLSDEGPLRVLRQRGELVTTVRDAGSTHIEIVNHQLGYTLRIDSIILSESEQ